MPDDLDQLVDEVADMTGAARPGWLEADAPLLEDAADDEGDFYLVGLIGGKDVGKSALVNALVGHEITAQTSHGPGTQTVIAYAHATREPALLRLLEREVPDRYRIITHDLPHLSRQVLLDLPDIDSHYADHVALTRRILRHLLFPVWMQSVEKYADLQPQELLAKVAAGNAPGNFVFCLNKVDQVERREKGTARAAASGAPASLLNPAIVELQEDYAQRLARVVGLPTPPRVWVIAALRPAAYELPALRNLLARQKSEEVVRQSRRQAGMRRRASILAWVEAQDVAGRAGRLRRLLDEAQETLDDRLGVPLLESFLPRLTDDPAYRQAIIDDCLARRAARWPIVGALHGFYFAVGTLVRRNFESRNRRSLVQDGDSLVETHLRELAGAEVDDRADQSADDATRAPARPAGRSIASLVQTTFAQLQQSYPAISELYRERKLWESAPAGLAAGDLRQVLARSINRQRAVACERLDSAGGSIWFFWRSLLTIGALAWFIFIWPLLMIFVQPPTAGVPGEGVLFRVVQTLGPSYLLTAFVGLIIYFTALWLTLRWDTQRRVQRQFIAWRHVDRLEGTDASLNLVGRTMQWIGDLLEPIRAALCRADVVAGRVEALRLSVAEGGGIVDEGRFAPDRVDTAGP